MQLILTILLFQSLGVWAGDFVKVYVRDVTYAGSCTYYNQLALGAVLGGTITSQYSSTCTSAAVSGSYVTQSCYSGILVPFCSPAVTATACASSASTRTTTTAPLLGLGGIMIGGGTATITATASTCSVLSFPPNPLQAVAGSVCYADNVNGVRTLSGPSTSSNTMTNAVCRTYCTNLGFAYSGTEYSSECYCGNTLPTVTSSSCNMACSNAGSTEICGGPNALSVLTNTAIVNSNNAAAATLASWFSKGCYSDNYPSRVLISSSTTSSSMTLESCITTCNNGGYTLAGLENGSECYCANSLQSDGATYGIAGQTGCTYTCAGKSSQICGGSNVLSLYSKSSGAVPIAAPPAPAPASAGGYTYVACYIDQNGGRTLAISKPAVASVEACITSCSSSGFKYAGVEYRNECWCDNGIRPGTTQIAAKNCMMPCTGATGETCGGSNAIQIYSGTPSGVSIPTAAGGYAYVDSYIDSPSARILPFQQSLTSNTVANCVRACSLGGYPFAGVEVGSQCFCGTTRLNNPVGGQNPNIPCTGNPALFCGGSNILQVYQGTPAPQPLTTPFTNGQCVADNTNNVRTLSVNMGSLSTMTPATCQTLCAGYKYYGVEYASECWCDNTFPAATVVSSACTMACSGDGAQICGGGYALNMYNS